MVQISEVHGICAPALPSVQDFMPLASTDGKAGAQKAKLATGQGGHD